MTTRRLSMTMDISRSNIDGCSDALLPATNMALTGIASGNHDFVRPHPPCQRLILNPCGIACVKRNIVSDTRIRTYTGMTNIQTRSYSAFIFFLNELVMPVSYQYSCAGIKYTIKRSRHKVQYHNRCNCQILPTLSGNQRSSRVP